ncbi:MAG: hypothetical protein U1E21_13340 [Reyranellaceae bacterium]
MISRRRMMTATATGALLTATGAWAQSQPIVGISTVTTYFADARITAVDTNARTVTFAFANGSTATRNVSAALTNFNAARIGQTVSVGFEDRLTFVLSGPNARPPADRSVSVTATATMGQSGATATADKVVVSWWVTAVDVAAGTISVVNPAGGEVRTYNVTTQAARDQLPRVKPGDNLTAIDSQVLVVSITPKS